MSRYRIFDRTWWADNACTIPRPGRKIYHLQFSPKTEEEAREICRKFNVERRGYFRQERNEAGRMVKVRVEHRGPRGLATEYEEV